MRRTGGICAVVSLWLAASGASLASADPTFHITALGVSGASALNDRGQVVGTLAGSGSRMFIYSGGKVIDLGVTADPGGINNSDVIAAVNPTYGGLLYGFANGNATTFGTLTSAAFGTLPGGGGISVGGLNDSGLVVGGSGSGVGRRAFEWSFGSPMTSAGTLPNGTDSYALGVNASGEFVGTSNDGSGHYVAFSSTGGPLTPLGLLSGYDNTVANAINASGTVVGWATGSGTFQAFIENGTTMTGLGYLNGGTSSRAFGINDAGHAIGDSTDCTGSKLAFYYNGASMEDLNSLIAGPHPTLTNALAINNHDQILATDGYYSYLLTPDGYTPAATPSVFIIPEPGPLALAGVLAVVAGLGGAFRRRQARPNGAAQRDAGGSRTTSMRA